MEKTANEKQHSISNTHSPDKENQPVRIDSPSSGIATMTSIKKQVSIQSPLMSQNLIQNEKPPKASDQNRDSPATAVDSRGEKMENLSKYSEESGALSSRKNSNKRFLQGEGSEA